MWLGQFGTESNMAIKRAYRIANSSGKNGMNAQDTLVDNVPIESAESIDFILYLFD